MSRVCSWFLYCKGPQLRYPTHARTAKPAQDSHRRNQLHSAGSTRANPQHSEWVACCPSKQCKHDRTLLQPHRTPNMIRRSIDHGSKISIYSLAISLWHRMKPEDRKSTRYNTEISIEALNISTAWYPIVGEPRTRFESEGWGLPSRLYWRC